DPRRECRRGTGDPRGGGPVEERGGPARRRAQGRAFLAGRRGGARRDLRPGGAGQRGRGSARDHHRKPARLPGNRAEGLGAGEPASDAFRPQALAELVVHPLQWRAARNQGPRTQAMPPPDGFSWIEQPLLAALARPSSAEDLLWLRQEGIELLISLTEE